LTAPRRGRTVPACHDRQSSPLVAERFPIFVDAERVIADPVVRNLGWEWVHLDQCLTCGHVGCCDSSRGRHADGHFRHTDHPVMRAVEPGEAWRWYYVDRVVG